MSHNLLRKELHGFEAASGKSRANENKAAKPDPLTPQVARFKFEHLPLESRVLLHQIRAVLEELFRQIRKLIHGCRVQLSQSLESIVILSQGLQRPASADELHSSPALVTFVP